MTIKQRIDEDVKTAMLAGDKSKVTVLRGLKSAILYVEVAKGQRGDGLTDEEIIEVFSKEAKKRQESADMYSQGGDAVRAEAELAEKSLIETYLPKQLSDDELVSLVDEVLANLDGEPKAIMGKAIAEVKLRAAGRVDGARVAQVVKSKLI